MAKIEIDIMSKGLPALLSDLNKIKLTIDGIKPIRITIGEGVNSIKQASDSISSMRNRLNELVNTYISLSAAQKKSASVTKNLVPEIQRLYTEVGRGGQVTNGLQSTIGSFADSLVSAVPYLNQFTTATGAISAVLDLAMDGVKKSFATNLKFDSLEYSLECVSANTTDFRTNMDFLAQTANKLGMDLGSTTETFTMWQRAVQSSNLTVEQSRDIFEGVANAGVKMGLSTDEVKDALLTLSQMVSKGNISMEDMRAYMDSKLPGAFAKVAQSMNMSEDELNKMIASGNIMAKDVLPKFVQLLDTAFGSDKNQKIDTMQASVTRLSNEWDKLWRSEAATTFFSTITDGTAHAIAGLNGLMSSWWGRLLLSSPIIAPNAIMGAGIYDAYFKKDTDIKGQVVGISKPTQQALDMMNGKAQYYGMTAQEYAPFVNKAAKEVVDNKPIVPRIVSSSLSVTKSEIEEIKYLLDGLSLDNWDYQLRDIDKKYKEIFSVISKITDFSERKKYETLAKGAKEDEIQKVLREREDFDRQKTLAENFVKAERLQPLGFTLPDTGLLSMQQTVKLLGMSDPNKTSPDNYMSDMSNIMALNEQMLLLQNTMDGVSSAFGSFFGDVIFDTDDAIANLSQSIQNLAKTAVSELAKIAIQSLINKNTQLTGIAQVSAAGALANAATKTQAAVTGASVTASMAPAAGVSSVASWGGAAIAGLAALMAVMAFVKGFRGGGYTGNISRGQIAGLVHGREYVFDAASTRRIGVGNLRALQMGKVSPESMYAMSSYNRSIDVSGLLHSTGVSLPYSATQISDKPQRVDVVVHGEISGDVIKLVNDEANRSFRRFYRE